MAYMRLLCGDLGVEISTEEKIRNSYCSKILIKKNVIAFRKKQL